MAENEFLQTPHKRLKDMLDKRFLIAEMFEEGLDKVLTIKAIQEEKIENPKDGSFDIRPVIYFEEIDRQLGLNKVNIETIDKLYGNVTADKLVGKKIQLYTTTTKAFNNTVSCIRIRKYIPEIKCSVCGKEVDMNTYLQSVKKYGRAYCSKACLDKATKGDDILAKEGE